MTLAGACRSSVGPRPSPAQPAGDEAASPRPRREGLKSTPKFRPDLYLRQSGREDLNLRPHGPEPCALAKLSYAPPFIFTDPCILATLAVLSIALPIGGRFQFERGAEGAEVFLPGRFEGGEIVAERGSEEGKDAVGTGGGVGVRGAEEV